MSFGIDLFKDNAASLMANSDNVFFVDYIDLAAGQHSKSYPLAPGETLYAVPFFEMAEDAGHPYFGYCRVSGNTVSWSGETSPTVGATSHLLVYKKGNISSIPAVNSFGAMFTNDKGNLFVVSDADPFTYHDVYTLSGDRGPVEVDTGVPADCKVMVFQRIDYSRGLWDLVTAYFIKNGTWHLSMEYSQTTVEFYVFTDRELRDVRGSTNYGFEFYDKNGRVVIGHNSKPLKVYTYTASSSDQVIDVDIGVDVAVPTQILGVYKNYTAGNLTKYGGYYTTYGINNSLGSGSQEICKYGLKIPADRTDFPRQIIYIKTDEYKNG